MAKKGTRRLHPGDVQLSTGTVVNAFELAFGVMDDLAPAEQCELADRAIKQWTAYKAKAMRELPRARKIRRAVSTPAA